MRQPSRRALLGAGVAGVGLIGAPAVARQAPPQQDTLAERFPNSAWAERRRLSNARGAGEAGIAADSLGRLAAMGYALPEAQWSDIALPEGRRAELVDRFRRNGSERAASRVFASAPETLRLVEGVAWDEATGRLFATTVIGRSLLWLGGDEWHRFHGLRGGSLAGVAIDPARRRLWVASGSTPRTPDADTAFRGVIGVDLDTLTVTQRLPVEGEGSPSDLSVGPDGTVYAADPNSGAIHAAPPDGSRLSILAPAGTFNSPQGMAPAADGRRLYVSDYGLGLYALDPESGGTILVGAREPAMLDGIDGLLAHGRDLIAIQNGTEPKRILRLVLNAGGDAVDRVEVLERAVRGWGEPTLGVLRGDSLLYVADSQGDRFGANGVLLGEAPLRATAIRELPLAAAARSGA